MTCHAVAILVVALARAVFAAEDLTTYVSPNVSAALGFLRKTWSVANEDSRLAMRVVVTPSPASPGLWG